MKDKVKGLAAVKKIAESLRKRGERIVFTNGCFDILHVGHVDYLAKARKMGDVLVIGLNSDLSVKRLKGTERPLNSQVDRAKVLSALSSVDYVTIFDEDTPERLIEKIRPDILVKGGDWKEANIAGAAFVKSYGGKVRIVPFVKGYSTTLVVNKLRNWVDE
ncbi:MAG: D-glycero-beta-D-manno-heptose 1-phosphate adenylyltransferase [Candidatus Omnitrophica bacterium]|nr:D-glycero-beta-D-manno-heptose 1-phosphate adenylyltransferase [Candidatus Omnitrophota bacterium]MDD5437448.1 D-glycero-beta-D-manno-heptose 1-phosphate adenylyltransferase [Candidatus Omnitrophota bacterium]